MSRKNQLKAAQMGAELKGKEFARNLPGIGESEQPQRFPGEPSLVGDPRLVPFPRSWVKTSQKQHEGKWSEYCVVWGYADYHLNPLVLLRSLCHTRMFISQKAGRVK